MKPNPRLTVSSLLSIGLSTLHLTDDALHASEGMTSSDVATLLLIMLTMLYGTVELAGRRAGFVIMLLGGLGAASMPFLHGIGPRTTRWGFVFVWTLFALGVAGSYTAILAAREMWRSFRSPANSAP